MNPAIDPVEKKCVAILILLAVLANCSGLFVTILGPDGALYASIAKTMVIKNDYVSLFAEGHDWLDKPHFPFWITAFSFKLFGATTWAYKLPAILFLFMGAGYTYALAAQLYNKRTAYWSVIVLLTAEHIIISNNDVRAEPYLTGLIIAAVYHLYKAYKNNQYLHLVAGALFAACAVMTKGMFALIPVCGAIGLELLIKKDWKNLFHIRWLTAALLILLFITPELYCLYYQFDAHPEKTVFGQTGVSGIRFFFWDSQFGRFFNTGPIRGNGDPFFFLHTLLWAFLPWSVVMYAAIIMKTKTGWKHPQQTEWLTLGGAIPCLLVFSLSRFQLPHYSNILFPFLAILTAQYLLQAVNNKHSRLIHITQLIIVTLLPILAVALYVFFQPGNLWAAITVALAAIALWFVLPLRTWAKNNPLNPVILTVWVAVWMNIYLNLVFYPALLRYQSGSEAAMIINRQYPGMPVVQLRNDYSYALEFYLQTPLWTANNLQETENLPPRPFILYAGPDVTTPAGAQPVQIFEHFHVSQLTIGLLNHATRSKETRVFRMYLVK